MVFVKKICMGRYDHSPLVQLQRREECLINFKHIWFNLCLLCFPLQVLDQPIDVNDGNLKASGNTDQKKYSEVKLKIRSNEFQKVLESYS